MFAAEMINARSGLGHMIRTAENSLRFDLMYVSLLASPSSATPATACCASRARRSPGRSSPHEAPRCRWCFVFAFSWCGKPRRAAACGASCSFPRCTRLHDEFSFFANPNRCMEAWVSL
jgi:hypothetical protein